MIEIGKFYLLMPAWYERVSATPVSCGHEAINVLLRRAILQTYAEVPLLAVKSIGIQPVSYCTICGVGQPVSIEKPIYHFLAPFSFICEGFQFNGVLATEDEVVEAYSQPE